MVPKRLSDGIPRWGAHIAFWDWIIRAIYAGGTLAVAWWAAARAYAEGVIAPYGTVGYIAVIGAVVVIASLLAISAMAPTWSVTRFKRGEKPATAIGSSGRNAQVTATALQGPRVGARHSPDLVHRRNENIELYYLRDADNPTIENHVFENCNIVGLAVILPNLVIFNGKTIFRGSPDINQSLIEVEAGRVIAGVISMRNCTFTDCAFRNVAFIADRPFLDTMRELFRKKT